MELTKALIFGTCLLLLSSEQAEGAKVICSLSSIRVPPRNNRWCRGIAMPCPIACPTKCRVDCERCVPSCGKSFKWHVSNLSSQGNCNARGAVCQDPKFVGGDGNMFYFHGKKDKDFCIVTDMDVHINAHFIGKSKKSSGLKRDFTWVQSLGILFGKHKFFIGAKKVAAWDDSVDQLEINLDGVSIALPTGVSAVWEEPISGLRIERIAPTNDVSIDFADIFNLKVQVTPVTEDESRVHNYGISKDDCFAHLDISFEFHKLSPSVDGVLGKTYAPGYQSEVNSNLTMPVMGGYQNYLAGGIFEADCAVSRFGQEQPGDMLAFPAIPMKCGTDGKGFSCRKR